MDERFNDAERELMVKVLRRSVPVIESPDLRAHATDDLWTWLETHHLTTLGELCDYVLATNVVDLTTQAELLQLPSEDRQALSIILYHLEPTRSQAIRRLLRSLPGANPDRTDS